MLNHQGRVTVEGVLHHGTGQFKFALVNDGATQTYWRNAPDSDADGEPDQAVGLEVRRGLYSVLLGDTSLPHMAALPPAVFEQPVVFLRVWFDDGSHGSQRLAPDQRLASVGYALMAGNVPDGTISATKLAPGTLDGLVADIAALRAAMDDLVRRQEILEEAVLGGVPKGVPMVSVDPADPDLTALGLSTFMEVPAPFWMNGATRDAPSSRFGHTAIWTGQHWVVWGGTLGGGVMTAAGASYDPAHDQWNELPGLGASEARRGHAAVWTGQTMLIWGGFGLGYLGGGMEYNPSLTSWTPLSAVGAPEAREGHLGFWTGARMLVWGGRNTSGLLAGGSLYDPVGRSWSELPTANAPAGRIEAAGAWTGAEFILWGGLGEAGLLGTGALLPLNGGATPGVWKALATVNAPTPRSDHTAVWTGERLLVWGGRAGDVRLGDGGIYDPAEDQWEVLPSVGAPTPRSGHVAVWTGQEMLICGGQTATGTTGTGAAFNPTTGSWRPLTSAGGPVARSGATACWSGSEFLVFGGQVNGTAVAALQRLNPQPTWYFYRKP